MQAGLSSKKRTIDGGGNFDVTIPLNILLGYAEGYQNILVNMKHELVMTRSRNDLDAVTKAGTTIATTTEYEAFGINIKKI